MKKIVLTICTIVLFFNAQSQKTYQVDYLYRITYQNSSELYNDDWTCKLIFNDTSSFYYMIINDLVKDELANKDSIGNKLIHHSYYYSAINKTPYAEVNMPGHKYLIADTLNKFNWIFTNQTKTVCTYSCKMAYTVQNENDTIMVWYAQNFGKNYGPVKLVNLPGIVLEAIDQRYSLYYLATSIQETSQKLVSPLPFYKIKKSKRKRNQKNNN